MNHKIAALSMGAAAALALTSCSHPAPKPSVTECTKEIVAHPAGTDPARWPGCKGLSDTDLWKATAAAMAQGAVG